MDSSAGIGGTGLIVMVSLAIVGFVAIAIGAISAVIWLINHVVFV